MATGKSGIPPRTCLCAPTTHPGSFRCSFHRGGRRPTSRSSASSGSLSRTSTESTKARSLNALLMQIIRPSSRDLSRRRNFQPKPSRFCVSDGISDRSVAVV